MKIKLLVNFRTETDKHCCGDVIEVSKRVGERLVEIGQAVIVKGAKKEAAALEPDTENAAEDAPEKR